MTSDQGVLKQDDVPDGWTYDPGWTWSGVAAAIHDDGYPVAPEPDYETAHGYLIEINEGVTEATLVRNDEADRHTQLATESLDEQNVAGALSSLVEKASADSPEVKVRV